MPYPKGQRFGGRQKGTLNKGTIERRQIAAEIATRQAMESKASGKKLAREVLEEFMIMFRGVAAQYQPLLASGERNPTFDAEQFERWALHACDAARWLAPYQSPTYKAIGINLEMQRRLNDDDEEPVRYRTVKEIRAELAARGLPPLQHIIEAEPDEDGTFTIEDREP